MKKRFLFLLLTALWGEAAVSQFSLDGQFRPRTEYRHGYASPIPDTGDAGFAISTRARLNTAYQTDAYEFYLSFQDVLVWGENRQLRPDDENNSFAIFEAWADISLGKGWSTKLGRQIISYDDQRILGGVDWAQQSRNHDAGLLKFRKERFMMDIGLAFSQDFDDPTGFRSVGTAYNTEGFFTYKTMQYLYLKQQWDGFSGSLLLLNNGFQNFSGEGDSRAADGVSNLKTLGTHLEYKKDGFGTAINAFLQTGERQNNLDVGGAYLLGLDFTFRASDRIGLGIGTELISGNQADTADRTEAFFPLYGTNHKFNGFMDYFYVGNHANSIGLFDVHASASLKLGQSSNLMVKVLNFRGEQELPSWEKYLGTEVDLVLSKSFEGYSLAIGYSQLFAGNGMYELKGLKKDNEASGQNWAWAMLTLKPKFLNTAKPE